MEVILLRDVEKVGLRGDVVSVARGYARNFLLPRGLAEQATKARVAEMQKRDAQRARHEAKTADEASAIAGTLAKTELRFEVKAGPTGSLFGSVTPTDIADELWKQAKVRVEVKMLVVPEGGELPSEDELAAMEAAELKAAEPEETLHEGPAIEELLLEEEEPPPAPADEAAAEAEAAPEWQADAEAALRENE
jgi:large subunit ribosomal protein L9